MRLLRTHFYCLAVVVATGALLLETADHLLLEDGSLLLLG
jgi:hypothetical protein